MLPGRLYIVLLGLCIGILIVILTSGKSRNDTTDVEPFQDSSIILSTNEFNTVPRIIHQMWYDKTKDNNTTPPESRKSYIDYMNSWREIHPNYDYVFWNKSMVNELWTHPELSKYKEFFASIHVHIEKCDFARYAILYLYGGVYIDLDFVCFKSIDRLRTNVEDVGLVREPKTHFSTKYRYITNGFMMSAPNSRFWIDLMDYIMIHYRPGKNPVDNTGPGIIDEFYNTSEYNVRFIPTEFIIPVDKTGKDISNGVQPYCKTIWEDGTGWNTTIQYKLTRLKYNLLTYIYE